MTHHPTHSAPINIQILKFGSSVLRDESDVPRVVSEIYRRTRTGTPVVAVVSALRGRTDRLVALADRVGNAPSDASPPSSARAALLGVGEIEAAAAIAIALEKAGLPARLIPPEQTGITADPIPYPETAPATGSADHTESEPVDTDPAAIRAALIAGEIPVVSGYIARTRDNRNAVLGRGGSDLTAIRLAHALNGEAVLLKGPGAIYEWDPAEPGPSPRPFAHLAYADALALGDRVLQPRAVEHARKLAVPFTVTGLTPDDTAPTTIGAAPTRHATESPRVDKAPLPPLRVAILGLGSVGLGVAQRLALEPNRFELIGALVRDPSLPRPGLPSDFTITNDPQTLLDAEPDLVIELIGGATQAAGLVATALRAGADVVTANKALIAEKGRTLRAIARSEGRSIRCAAAAGGALPILELAEAAQLQSRTKGRIESVRAILNGTTNFVLDRLRLGLSLHDALDLARQQGLTEADAAPENQIAASPDLTGLDAAHKLVLITRAIGWGDLAVDDIEREPLTPERALSIAARRANVRQVATLRLTSQGPAASVRLTPVDPEDPLATVTGPGNAARITFESGHTLTARAAGAGRWPTTESVFADIIDLYAERQSAAHTPATSSTPSRPLTATTN